MQLHSKQRIPVSYCNVIVYVVFLPILKHFHMQRCHCALHLRIKSKANVNKLQEDNARYHNITCYDYKYFL